MSTLLAVRMLRLVVASLCIVYVSASCGVTWPNGTETTFHWWECDQGPLHFYNVTPWDQSGKNYEYPIHLGAPILIKTDVNNPNHVFTEPNLRNTVNLWSWGGLTGCVWTSLPTLGLLTDLDACSHGVPCPVQTGRQELDIVIDFTPYQAIINMLKDNAPYQLQYLLHDRKSGDSSCIMVQARAYLQ